MLVLRRAQLEILAEPVRDRFVAWMATHLRRWFPDELVALDDAGLEAFIRRGIERANGYGFRDEQAVCRYIDLMAVFGPAFDADPRHPWAARVLTDRAITSAEERIEALGRAARAQLRSN